jgi:hypothetical protein
MSTAPLWAASSRTTLFSGQARPMQASYRQRLRIVNGLHMGCTLDLSAGLSTCRPCLAFPLQY